MVAIFGVSTFSTIAITFISVVTFLILYLKHVYSYWSKRNIPFIAPQMPFGNMKKLIFQKQSTGQIISELYNKLKHTGHPYAGLFMFWKPTLVLLDPETVKLVMTKEFQYFSSRPLDIDVKVNPITGHLLNLNGDAWKFMRSKLTPTFTSGKMKMMFDTITSCSEHLQVILDEHITTAEPLEVKDTMGRFTTDIIGSCAFGIECNSLKEPDNIFRKRGKRIFEPTAAESLKDIFIRNFPKLSSTLALERIPKDTTYFFMNLVKDTVEYREKNNIRRKDFMDLLIQLKTEGNLDNEVNQIAETGKLTIEQIAAQCFVFFAAGFETSSTALSSIMYELSLHQDVQDTLRNEINDILRKHNGEVTYEAIMEMKYLEEVINESMRLHTVIPMVGRKCVRDFKFPDNEFTIKKGTTVFIPIKGLHEDPEYYPNPAVFDADRFSPEEKSKRHPYAFLPFGAGPRNCIGLRFGMLQMKVGLVALLKNHRFTLNSKTQTPLTQNPKNEFLNYIGGIWVNAVKVE